MSNGFDILWTKVEAIQSIISPLSHRPGGVLMIEELHGINPLVKWILEERNVAAEIIWLNGAVT